MKIVIFKAILIVATLSSNYLASKLFLSERNQLGISHQLGAGAGADNSTNATAGNMTAGNMTGGNIPNGTNATAPSGKTGGTGVFQGLTNSSNALGFVGPTEFAISAAPYKVKSCDQVLLIPGQRITDFNDYCKKNDGFLTMSVYMFNLFEVKDSNKLLESITLDRMTNMPTHLSGAPACVDFRGGDRRIAFCLDNNDIVEQLIEAYTDFMRCRMGENLKQLSWKETRDIILKGCMGQKDKFDASKFLADGNFNIGMKNNLPSITGISDNFTVINPYYAELKVPGS